MPYDGNGLFSVLNTFVNGTVADAVPVNATLQDIADGLSNALTLDGQSLPTQNIDWNAKKLTNLGLGTNPTDGAQHGEVNNAAGRNILLNGGFDLLQPSGFNPVVGTASRLRVADGWWAVRGGGVTGYTTIVGGVIPSAGMEASNCLLWQRDSGNSSTQPLLLGQSLESVDYAALAALGQGVVFSFYAFAGSNYSGGQLTVQLILGASNDENVLDGFTGQQVWTQTFSTLTTSWQRFYFGTTGLVAGKSQLGVKLSWTPTGVAGANDYIGITGLQLEAGNIASGPSRFRRPNLTTELLRAQRYYQKSFNQFTAPAQNAGAATGEWRFGSFLAGAVSNPKLHSIRLPVPMRAPVVTLYNPSAANGEVRNFTKGANCSASAAVLDGDNLLALSYTGSGTTAVGDAMGVHYLLADPIY